jgi:hypothetical protein
VDQKDRKQNDEDIKSRVICFTVGEYILLKKQKNHKFSHILTTHAIPDSRFTLYDYDLAVGNADMAYVKSITV